VSFELDLKAFADKTSVKANAVVRKIVIEVGGALVFKSPVGDASYWKNPPPPGYVGGRFRANWQYGFNSIDRKTTDKLNRTKYPDYESAGLSVDGLLKIPKDAAGSVYYITNSLPYADRLENGWSRQAPHGMVGLTVLEYKPIVEAAARAVQ
jgi:hypothetical protein